MPAYTSADIRNLVLCGHSGAGKTILAEAMLLKSGVLNRLGSIGDGTTVCDFQPEEKEHKCSLSAAMVHFSFDGKEFNVVDTPGAMGFVGATISGITGTDLAIICVNAAKGVEVMARNAWDIAGKMGLGRMIALTRMDAEGVNYQETLASVQKVFGKAAVPFTIPTGEGESFSAVTRVMAEDSTGEEVAALRQLITENAVECDESLLEKYLGGETIDHDSLLDVMQRAVADGHIVPVFSLAAERDIGVEDLMHGISEWGPDPLHAHHAVITTEGEKKLLAPDPEGTFLAQVFKIVSDAHVGKLAFFRVFSGSLAAKSTAYIASAGKPEKFTQLLRTQGEKRIEVSQAITGDIVAVPKLEHLQVGETIHGQEFSGRMQEIPFPEPMAGLAVTPKVRGGEQKMSQNFHRLCEEDPTFRFERNELTNEQVIRGIGPLHLDIILHRLQRRYGIEVDTRPPRIPYLETITKSGEGRYRHKKQSGGAGQFAEVWMRAKPSERGSGFTFVNSIVGGAISGSYIPSVEKGIRAALSAGPVAGYPVVDVEVELYDGKEHPVDSKDIAFQAAAKHGFVEIMQQCKPVLLEPIVDLEVVFPAAFTGDISGDIATRRGRPTGLEQLGEMQVIQAQVPLAEVADYDAALRALTHGEGSYHLELSHYEAVPGNLTQQVVGKSHTLESC